MKRLLFALIAVGVIIWTMPSHADWGNNVGIQGLKWASVSTATTKVIKSTFCFVHTLTVTGGTSGAITLYASGSTVSGLQAYYWPSTNTPQSYILDDNFASGCTVVTSAATNVTVSYL